MSHLYLEHELAFLTQYAELKERTLAAGALLPGARLAETESHLLIQAFKSAPAPMIRPIKILATNLIDMAKKTEQPELVTILKKCLR